MGFLGMQIDPMRNTETKSTIHHGHRDRLRKRLELEGLERFEDHQVLELLLFSVLPRQDTNKIAHLLLKRFGRLSAVLEADVRDMVTIPGMGQAAASFLSFIPPLTRRYLYDRATWKKVPLTDPTTTSEFIIPLMVGRNEEVFYVLCLDNRCRLIFPALIARGTVNEAFVHLRHVIEAVLRHKAANVILAHNHPSGQLKPSKDDVSLTLTLQRSLFPLGIRLVDHVIVGENSSVSMASLGLLGDTTHYKSSARPNMKAGASLRESDNEDEITDEITDESWT